MQVSHSLVLNLKLKAIGLRTATLSLFWFKTVLSGLNLYE